ncbi:hypothetical protein [Noviherbaspirillum soli]|uniref:hypothetical protein n=1 Tax=Noviherbaspirillum soli TaxID=1064518 RepID=UPI00188AC94A|nr:hypothetical protein [Noviherbaspirillum soli]
MDGTPGSTSTGRNSNGPGGLPPTPRVPTIKDPFVLYQKGFISEAQLKAETSKSRENAKTAWQEVRALVGWIDSKAAATQTGKKNSPVAKLSEKKAEEALIQKYQKDGYQFIQSKTPTDSLISSLLTLFSNDVQANHQAKIKTYRDKLNTFLTTQNRATLKEKDSARDEHIHDIVKKMRNDKGLKFRDRAVEIWRANDRGEVVKLCLGDGAEKVILFQQRNKFSAVIPPQKQTPAVTPTDSDDDIDNQRVSPKTHPTHPLDISDNENDADDS